MNDFNYFLHQKKLAFYDRFHKRLIDLFEVFNDKRQIDLK